MSSTAVQLRQSSPTTRPSHRYASPATARGPVSHPQRSRPAARPIPAGRKAGPGLVGSTTRSVRGCHVVTPRASTTAGWRLTERGYAVVVSALGASAVFLATAVAATFFAISNAPVG